MNVSTGVYNMTSKLIEVGGNTGTVSLIEMGGEVEDFTLFDIKIQPSYANPCKTDNGECEQICRPTSNGTKTCDCYFGFTLQTDSQSCGSG